MTFKVAGISKLNSYGSSGLWINSSLSQMQIRYHTIKRVSGVSDWWGGGDGGGACAVRRVSIKLTWSYLVYDEVYQIGDQARSRHWCAWIESCSRRLTSSWTSFHLRSSPRIHWVVLWRLNESSFRDAPLITSQNVQFRLAQTESVE